MIINDNFLRAQEKTSMMPRNLKKHSIRSVWIMGKS